MKLLLFIPIVVLIGFILWMNLTPGHFQLHSDCFGEVKYITNDKVVSRFKAVDNIDRLPVVNGKIMLPPNVPCELSPRSWTSLFGGYLILFSWLDFYK